MSGSIRVQANGQTLAVNFTRTNGAAASVFSDAGLTSAVSLPATISSDTYFYFPTPETYVVSVKLNGVEIASNAGGTLTQFLPGNASTTIAPSVDGFTERAAVDGGAYVSALGIYQPEKFGAVRDGVTDDTAAIQAAINAANTAGGGVVPFAQGTHLVTGLQHKSRVRLAGSGWGTVLKLKNGANAHLISLASGQVAQTLIRDIYLDGNKANQSAGAWDLIHYDNTGYVPASDPTGFYDCWHRISNVGGKNATQDGISLTVTGGVSGGETLVDSCYIEASGRHGYYLATRDSNLLACAAGGNGYAGFYNDGASNMTYTRCKSFSNGNVSSGSGDGFALVGGARILMVSCEGESNTRHGFSAGGTDLLTLSACSGDSNSYDQAGGISASAGSGFRFTNCTNVTGRGLKAYNRRSPTSQKYGLVLEGTTANCDIDIEVTAFLTAATSLITEPTNRVVLKTTTGGVQTVSPEQPGNLMLTGEETRSVDTINVAVGAATQEMMLTYFTARRTESITKIAVSTGTTAAAATPTLVRYGVYEIDSAGAGTLVASTTNDTTLLAATTTEYEKALSATWSKVAGKRYAFALLIVTAATSANIAGSSFLGAAATVNSGARNRRVGRLFSQIDLPASFTNASLNSTNKGAMYAEFRP